MENLKQTEPPFNMFRGGKYAVRVLMTSTLGLFFTAGIQTYAAMSPTCYVTGAALVNAINVNGRVVDENGTPMPGVSVLVKGTANGTSTDANGYFLLAGVNEGAIIRFSFVGYAVKEVPAKSNLGTVGLSPTASALKNVVITGYTNYKKSQSASSATMVGSEKINNVPGLTLDQTLQGRVPGMSVISSSGQPGQSAAVVIRGIGSVSGSSAPLYILDGIPVESGYMQTINPDDIETATVLKDATATALYGSRGSNGVIVLTTKRGKTGKALVEYTTQYGFSNLSRPAFTMMNTAQRLQFEEEVGLNYKRTLGPGWTYSPKNPNYTAGTPAFRAQADRILDSLKGINTDWRDIFFQKGRFNEHQLAVSGGGEGVRYYNSLNYYYQEGVAKRTSLERVSLRSNIDFTSGKLSGSTNISIGYSNSSFTEGEGGTGAGTAMASVYYALPYEYPYNPEGVLVPASSLAGKYPIYDQREGSLALERLLNSSNKTNQLKTIIGFNLAYQLLPELKITTRAGVDYRNSNDMVFINPDSYYGSRSNSNTLGGKGRLDEGNRRNFNVISTTGLTYAKVFNAIHDVEASAFYEYVYNNYNSYGFSGYGIDGRLPETPAGITNGNATYMPTVSGGKTASALASFMGVGRYTYDGKYTITGSYRYDGSTKVAPVNKWHGFYSVGGAWNATRERFLENSNVINDLRFRVSYGTTASALSGDFSYLATYGGTTYGGVGGLRPLTPGNPNYDWEYVNELNVGMDLQMFKSRLRLTADYYNKLTTNMFFDQPLSATAGFSTLPLSSGKMRNRGVELDLSGDVIRLNDIRWTVGVNAGYNKNKILYLTPLSDMLMDGDSRVFKVGMPYGTYYAPEWAGVDPATGNAQYYNLDGTITTTYNAATQSTTKSGSLYPSLTGGISTSVNWKGLSMSTLFSFVENVMRWNNEDFYNENQRYATSNQSVRMLDDIWKQPGDVKTLQRFDVPRNFTSKDIQDASFVRWRNLTLAYNMPAKVLEHTKIIKGVKIFLQGQNLYTWTKWRGLDPENNGVYGRFQYPNTRTYTAGVTLALQ